MLLQAAFDEQRIDALISHETLIEIRLADRAAGHFRSVNEIMRELCVAIMVIQRSRRSSPASNREAALHGFLMSTYGSS
jgi:hypothetical protein